MIDNITNAFIEWCARDSAAARFQRSIVQGIIGVLVAGLTTGEWSAAAIVGVIMAVISPIQHAIGNKGEVD